MSVEIHDGFGNVYEQEHSNPSKQKIALDKTAALWNSFCDIPTEEMHPDDNNDFKFHLHALQNLLYTQCYIKEHGKL